MVHEAVLLVKRQANGSNPLTGSQFNEGKTSPTPRFVERMTPGLDLASTQPGQHPARLAAARHRAGRGNPVLRSRPGDELPSITELSALQDIGTGVIRRAREALAKRWFGNSWTLWHW
jgi:hypothetical protein